MKEEIFFSRGGIFISPIQSEYLASHFTYRKNDVVFFLLFFRNKIKPGLSNTQDDPTGFQSTFDAPLETNTDSMKFNWNFDFYAYYLFCLLCSVPNTAKNMTLFSSKSKTNFTYNFAQLHCKFKTRVNTYSNLLNCISINNVTSNME